MSQIDAPFSEWFFIPVVCFGCLAHRISALNGQISSGITRLKRKIHVPVDFIFVLVPKKSALLLNYWKSEVLVLRIRKLLILVLLGAIFNLSEATTERHFVPIAACSRGADLSCGVQLRHQETALSVGLLRIRINFTPVSFHLLASLFFFYTLDHLIRLLWDDFTLVCTSDFADEASAFSLKALSRRFSVLDFLTHELGARDTIGFVEAATEHG